MLASAKDGFDGVMAGGGCVLYCRFQLWQAEMGTHNFFWGLQLLFRNLKEGLLQTQFRNFKKNCSSATAIPQLH
jgi:hypothetical protein